jgi:membrane protein implicated in regulation of membrane protease activity
MDEPPQFGTPQFVVTLAMLGLVAMVIYRVLWSDPPFSSEVQLMVITLVIGGLAEIRKYWLNSTAESQAKNQTIATQAQTAAAAQQALLDPAVVVTVGKPAETPPTKE